MLDYFIKLLFRDRKLEIIIVYQQLFNELPNFYEEELTCVPEEILLQLEEDK